MMINDDDDDDDKIFLTISYIFKETTCRALMQISVEYLIR